MQQRQQSNVVPTRAAQPFSTPIPSSIRSSLSLTSSALYLYPSFYHFRRCPLSSSSVFPRHLLHPSFPCMLLRDLPHYSLCHSSAESMRRLEAQVSHFHCFPLISETYLPIIRPSATPLRLPPLHFPSLILVLLCLSSALDRLVVVIIIFAYWIKQHGTTVRVSAYKNYIESVGAYVT